MKKNGWAFWTRKNDWRGVHYVGIAEFNDARKAVEDHVGDATIEAYNEIPATVRNFLDLTDGKILDAHVLN